MTANPYFSSFTQLPDNQLARAEAVNAIFQAIIGGFNLLPDNNALAQDRVSFAGNDTGSANVYVIAPPMPITSYTQGAQFAFIASNANTGASTINVSGVGAVALKRQDLTNLVAGDITAGMIVQVRYDGTQFQLTSLPGSSVALASASATNAANSATAAATSATAAANSATASANSATASAASATSSAASAASITGVLSLSGSGNPNGISRAEITNSNAGANVEAMFSAYNGGTICNFGITGTGYAAGGGLGANTGFLTASGPLFVFSALANTLSLGTNSIARMTIDPSGFVAVPNSSTASIAANNTSGAASNASSPVYIRCQQNGSDILLMGDAFDVINSAFPSNAGCVVSRADLYLGAAAGSGNIRFYNGTTQVGYWGANGNLYCNYALTVSSGITVTANSASAVFASGMTATVQGFTSTGFGYTSTFNYSGASTTDGGGFAVQCISGGVILSNGATSWASNSERTKKKNFQPIISPLELVGNIRAELGHYTWEGDDAKLRPFVFYEDAEKYWPWAATHRPASTRTHTDEKTGKTETKEVPEFKGVSYELYVPLLLAAFHEQIEVNKSMATRLDKLEGK